jgi:hypothetical protein
MMRPSANLMSRIPAEAVPGALTWGITVSEGDCIQKPMASDD